MQTGDVLFAGTENDPAAMAVSLFCHPEPVTAYAVVRGALGNIQPIQQWMQSGGVITWAQLHPAVRLLIDWDAWTKWTLSREARPNNQVLVAHGLRAAGVLSQAEGFNIEQLWQKRIWGHARVLQGCPYAGIAWRLYGSRDSIVPAVRAIFPESD